MKTIEIKMNDTIYSRLKVAGTKHYQDAMPNPDYDPDIESSLEMIPNTQQTRDEYLAEVIDKIIKGILKEHEVNEASRDAMEIKENEIDKLSITSTIL